MDQSPAAVAQQLANDFDLRKQELILAVTADDRETILRLLDEGVPGNTTNNEWVSLMHGAASCGHVGTTRLLIKRGGNVNAVDKRGLTPLHAAAAQGQAKVVRELISNGASKEAVASTFGTPLHQATSKGHVETAKAMLEDGCPLDIVNSVGATVLHWAAEGGHVKVVRELIDRGCDVNVVKENGCTALHCAAAHGRTEVVRELLKHGAMRSVVSNMFGTALQQAHLNGHTGTVEAISKDGASDLDLNVSNVKPLPLECNDIDTTATFGVTPEMEALLFGKVEMFKQLISKEGSISDRDVCSLSTFEHCFIGGQASKLVQFCDACGIGRSEEGLSGALSSLINEGHVDPNKVLCLCAISGDCVFLENEFADLLTPSTCVMPAALKCAMFYFFNGVKFINKLNIPDPDKCSMSPLHMSLLSLKCYRMGYATSCVQYGTKNHKLFITKLLSHPVLKEAVNENFQNGLSPLDLAQQFELHDIVPLIERAGGRPGVGANIPWAIEARHPTALLQVKEAYASIRAIAEDGKQGSGTIRSVLSSLLQSETVETEVQTDSMLDSMWHPNAVIIGADVDPETDEHEYKSLMVPEDKSKNPPLMCPCRDIPEVLKKVENHKKEINAMLNHHTGGTVHFGIKDKDNTVEEGLVLNQSVVIDRLQTKVSQILQEFYPAVKSGFVTIQPIDLLNNARERTGQWRFDIRVSSYGSFVFLSRKQTIAYYRQGANSEPMPADMLIERIRGESVRSESEGGLRT